MLKVKYLSQSVLQDSCYNIRLEGKGNHIVTLHHMCCNRQVMGGKDLQVTIFGNTVRLTCLSVGIGVSLSMASYFASMAP